MKKVIIVGEAPGKVPAEKSPTINRIKKWVQEPFEWTNKSYDELELVRAHEKVIAMGNIASDWLSKNGVQHLKIPHPSPRNRMWNNPQTEIDTIQRINDYLR